MSYDDNKIKYRNSQLYFNFLHLDRKRKFTKINLNTIPRQSKMNNKFGSKISIQRRNKKQLTIGPLSSTLESTISTTKHQNEEDNLNLPSDIHHKISINSKKLLKPEDEDMKFIFDIFYNSNKCYRNIQYDNLKLNPKINGHSTIAKETIESNYNGKNKYDFKLFRKYLIKIQKKYNINGTIQVSHNNLYNNKSAPIELMDSYHLQKLEDLIARYSLIIYLFIKCGKIKQAKEIFLVMLKENMNNLIAIEGKISSKYLIVNRNVDVYRDVPKITYGLTKMFSFLIKYSQIFNMANYHNIFIYKYFQILFLNYKFFLIKGISRGFSGETRNQIKYWLSYCFHNCAYYCIYNYIPLKAPILFNYNIINLYNNFDEPILTDLEKSLLIKTYFNDGILYYINDQKEEALTSLILSKEKITSFNDDYYANFNFNEKRKNIMNIFKNRVKEDVIEISSEKRIIRKKSTINPFKIKFIEEANRNEEKNKNMKIISQKDLEKSNDFLNLNNLNTSLLAIDTSLKKSKDSQRNKYEDLKDNIYKGFKKDKITIGDIELLVQFGKENGILSDEHTSGAKGLDFLFKYKESFSAIKKKITLPKGFRGSHIDFHTNMKIKDFFIPERFKNPLMRKIELLMALIELKKNNFEASYEHVLKVLYILFLLKLSNNYNVQQFNKQKIEINEYFKLIEDIYEKEFKNKQILEKSSSKSIFSSNERKSQNNINNNNINNSFNNYHNNNFIIFENKNAENLFFRNHNKKQSVGDNNNENNIQQNNDCKNKDMQIVNEFEKFFIFLNNLSLYQIKILNETQPDSEKKNNLPIIFSNQFKDCLSRIQRLELDNLQTMTLNRFMLLKDPNKWIFPSNLNYLLIERNRYPPINKRKSFSLNLNRYDFIDETFMKTKEYKNYLAIINSEKSSPDIKEFLKKNKNFVFKIIKDSNEREINNMINYPYIIIDPIKEYKKKIKKYRKDFSNLNMDSKRPKTITHSFDVKKIDKVKNFSRNISTEFGGYKNKKNKSFSNNFDQMKNSLKIKNTNIYNKYNINYIIENKKFNNDEELNQSFEEFLLSPEFSSFNEE